ncbi:ATP-dependent RNA helicase SrmB [Catenovulum agarivorans DS-2]|uniref:ATP-dependent RNA helicase SrmB n=1 Tax=Catenovulum agarivorans DS-2 TaxID=1328313 RepID=W7R044_9ALTE|nr:ATP-dependent RNA helicase SrmB [Catenovulum agarivorans]EWH10985.1 ATP-dependent RNA helicase SrmB [Catenovulum agarivorans DS-2]
MNFADLELDQSLLTAIEQQGYARPTVIQTLAIEPALEGKDILASAPTGTGKTAAFVLPALQHILDFPRQRQNNGVRILILSPTRELAEQTFKVVRQLSQFTEVTSRLITGGINYGKHKEISEGSVDIVVATPGRLLEYIEDESFDCRDIEWLVLDEADRMLDMGFGPTMMRVSGEARWRKQSLLFSATLEGEGVERFAKQVLKDPVMVEADSPRREKAKIHQWIHLADSRPHKLELLVHWLAREEVTKSVVFVKTRERVAELSGQLTTAQLPCCWLQGEMPQDKRQKAIKAFSSGHKKILVATDVAARGLDVADVSHVFNFDMPRTADVYVHRIGRTGRAGKKGTAISLVEAHDMEILGKVERYIQEKLPRRVVEGLEPQNREAKIPSKKPKKKVRGLLKKKQQKAKQKKRAKKA